MRWWCTLKGGTEPLRCPVGRLFPSSLLYPTLLGSAAHPDGCVILKSGCESKGDESGVQIHLPCPHVNPDHTLRWLVFDTRTERLPDRCVDLILPGKDRHLSLANVGGEKPCHELGSDPTEAAELSGQNLIFSEHSGSPASPREDTHAACRLESRVGPILAVSIPVRVRPLIQDVGRKAFVGYKGRCQQFRYVQQPPNDRLGT